MRAGGGLHFIDGAQGHGKSFKGIRLIGDSLINGAHVVTNVPLVPGWEKLISRHNPKNYFRSKKHSHRDLRERYHYVDSIDAAMKFRLLCIRCGSEPLECGHEQPDGLAVIIWDEAHNELSNRDWSGRGATKEAQEQDKQRRARIILWATQLRKLGYEGYLITQHYENVDVGLRRVAGWRIRMLNQRENVRFLGMRILPFPLFIARYYPANETITVFTKPEFKQVTGLSWHRKLYRTRAVFHGLADDLGRNDLTWLDPRPYKKRRRAVAPQGHPPAAVTETNNA